MEKRKRRFFPEEFKRQAVERAATSGRFLYEVAEELGVGESLLRRWIREYGEPGTGPARRPATQADTSKNRRGGDDGPALGAPGAVLGVIPG